MLLIGLAYLFRVWRQDKTEAHETLAQSKEDSKAREMELCKTHEALLCALNDNQRAFIEEWGSAQKVMMERVAQAMDRNTEAFNRLGNEERAAERQREIIDKLAAIR